MKTSRYVADNGLELEYILQKASSPSRALVVAFPGPGGGMRGGEWGYLVSIKKVADVNVLFLKTDPEYSKSRLTMRDGKPLIDEAIFGLVNKTAKEMGTEQIISVGTSMGGYSALYFGLKYDWDIISGSPAYTFSTRLASDIVYSMGAAGKKEIEEMNNLLASIIKQAGKKYSKKLFVSWGRGEPVWKKASEGPKMIRDMEEYHVNHTYALYPFSDHLTCAELFPQTLERYLKYYLGLSEKPSEDEAALLPPDARRYKGIADAYKNVAEIIDSLPSTKPNLDIKGNVIYGYDDNEVALRNYVYVKEGWLWSVEKAYQWGGGDTAKAPRKIEKYWDVANVRNDKTVLSFYFQSTLLSWYKRQPSDPVLKWLLDNAFEYVQSLPEIPKMHFNYAHQRPFDHMIRMSYFIELHRQSANLLTEKGTEALSDEVARSLAYIAEQGANPMSIRWQYRMVLGLLVAAMYYRASKAYEAIYAAAMDICNELNEYHFDRNGCCISDQMDSQDFLAGELKNVIDFVEENDMGKSKSFLKAKRVYKKVIEFISHICQPDNRLPALGHTSVNQWSRSRHWVEHKSDNCILRTSNIGILEDVQSVSYITVCGGSNVHSPSHRHCDLLSFTWNYAKKQVFYDAGGAALRSPLEEYVSSCIAHNGFVCDFENYLTPDYSDWTAIEEGVDQREDCAIVPTSHTLIEGVELKRKFFWIKPNILILIDHGTADRERAFAQNFLLGDFRIDRKNPSRVILQVSQDMEGRVLQHLGSEEIALAEYRGVDALGEDTMPRGTIVEKWRDPRRGLNLVYTKKGKEARFVTSIELHSKKHAGEEQTLQSVNFDADGNLVVVLGDGKVIYEKP